MPVPTIAVGDIVRVVNNGTKRLRLAWDSKKYFVEPGGGQEYVPYECAKLYFGDARASDNMATLRDQRGLVEWLPDRATEVRRLRLLWFPTLFGEYDAEEFEENGEFPFDSERMPHVEVYTVRDERILTVFDDPSGHEVIASKVTVAENEQLLDIVKRQGEMIQALMTRFDTSTLASMTLPHDEVPPDMVLDPKDDEIKVRPAAVPDDPIIYDDLPEVD